MSKENFSVKLEETDFGKIARDNAKFIFDNNLLDDMVIGREYKERSNYRTRKLNPEFLSEEEKQFYENFSKPLGDIEEEK